MRRAFWPVIFMALALAGCGDTWLGATEPPPLPGTRVSVILSDDAVKPDPAVATLNVSLPSQQSNADWAQNGGNAAHAMQNPAAATTLSRAWSADIGSGVSGSNRLLAGPVVEGGRVFVMDAEGTVSALELGTGKRIWEADPGDIDDSTSVLGGGVAVAEGRLFETHSTGYVVARELATGAEIWRQRILAPIRAAPAVADGTVIVATADAQTFALATSDGQTIWSHAGTPEIASLLGGATPAIADGIVVVPYSSGELFTLALTSGRPLWTDTVLRPRRTQGLGAITDIDALPAIDRGRVIVGGAGGETASFDLRRGGRSWTVDVATVETPWIAGEYVFVISENQELVGLLAQGGRVRWVTPLPRFVDPEDSTSGAVHWSGPTMAGGRLIVVGTNGDVLSVDPTTGVAQSSFSVSGTVRQAPIVADGNVLILTEGGELYAYR